MVMLGKGEGLVLCCVVHWRSWVKWRTPVEVYRICPFLSLSRYDIPSQEDLRVFCVHVRFFSYVVYEIGEGGVFFSLSQRPSKSLDSTILTPPSPPPQPPPHSMVQISKEKPPFFLSLNPPSPQINATTRYCNVLYVKKVIISSFSFLFFVFFLVGVTNPT